MAPAVAPVLGKPPIKGAHDPPIGLVTDWQVDDHGEVEPPQQLDGDILIVDDDAAVRTSMAMVLRACGYSVAECEDGSKALEHLRSNPVLAMLLDLQMPVLDGLGLLDRLDDPPPVVVVSARQYDAALAERRDKIFACMQKPVPADDLIAVVSRALDEPASAVHLDRP